MTAAEIRLLAALGLNVEQLAAVADLLDLRAACSSRPTSTARVRRWRELRREQAQGDGFSPQEDTCARPAPLPEEPASRPWNSPCPSHGTATAQPCIPASTQSTAAPITAVPAGACFYTFTAPAPVPVPAPVHPASASGSASIPLSPLMDPLKRHETFHRVSETFHCVSETPPAVSAPSPPPSLSPKPPIPPAPAPAPAHRPPPAGGPVGAHACAHEGSGWMIPDHEGPIQNQADGGHAAAGGEGNRIWNQSPDPNRNPDPDSVSRKDAGHSHGSDASPVPRPERRRRLRADAGPRHERARRMPPPSPAPSPLPSGPAVQPGTPPMSLEAATAAAGSHGVTAIIAEKWWLDLDARGWTDSKGRPIIRPWSSLRSYAIAWRAHEARDQAMAEAMLLRAMGGGGGGGRAAAGVDEVDWVDEVDRRPGTGLGGAVGVISAMGFNGAMGAAEGASRFGAGGRHRLSGPASSAAGQSRSRSRSRSAGPAPYHSSEKLEIKYL